MDVMLMVDPHEVLKRATGALHARAEQAFERFDVADLAGYRAFLMAQAGALLPLERAAEANGIVHLLPDWPERRRGESLLSDLRALGVSEHDLFDVPPAARGPSDPLGLAYVLEGSRHGARILLRRMLAGRTRSPVRATAFLGQPFDRARWADFLAILRRERSHPDQARALVAAAEDAFVTFERSAIRVGGETDAIR